ncbi:BQ2448_8021 [Microbotryum intermedium]|uniref:BQ2448_8021 protein n=1 Tax=Microbotryum intermedium TaxID=269621 RepID=A0A238FMK5_9BASI|nr:BQ2448_8021 [Microbotryum intermedium]
MSHDAEAKEAFALFDKRGAGSIPASSLGDVLRALGQNPTQKHVTELAAQAGNKDSQFSLGFAERVGSWDTRVMATPFLLVSIDSTNLGSLTDCRIIPIVDYQTFINILNRPGGYDPAGTEERKPCIQVYPDEFIRGFAVFDKDGTGYIGQGELKYVLTSLGEKLSDDEVDELLSGVPVTSEGTINYVQFVRQILAQ